MGRLAVAVAELVLKPALPRLELRPVPVGELGLVDDGVVEVGVDVPQVPIALFSEIGLPRKEGTSFLPGDSYYTNLELAPSPTGELVESFVVKLPTMDPPAPWSSGRKGRSRVHARSALTTGLRGPTGKETQRTRNRDPY